MIVVYVSLRFAPHFHVVVGLDKYYRKWIDHSRPSWIVPGTIDPDA
jgi:hypothetical protein